MTRRIRVAGMLAALMLIAGMEQQCVAGTIAGANTTAEYFFQGNTNDSSGNGYNGTVTGTPAFGSGPDGRSAFSFDGSTSIATTTSNNLGLYNQSFTVDAFVNFSDLGGDRAVFGNNGSTVDQTMHLQERIGGTPAVPAIMMGFYGDDLQPNSPQLFTNNWYNVAWVYDASAHTQSIYIDGSLVASSGGHNNFQGNGATMSIGQDCCGGPMQGSISNLFVFDSALTGDQIQLVRTVVPEPASLGLLAIGLVGVGLLARRRAAKSA